MLFAVENNVANLEHAGKNFRLYPSQQRLDPRQKLRRRKRLDQIVVGAGREAAHTITFLAPRRQHDDRQSLCLGSRSQAPAQFYPRNSRHHPVKDQKVRHVLLKPELSFVATRDNLNLISLRFQIVAK